MRNRLFVSAAAAAAIVGASFQAQAADMYNRGPAKAPAYAPYAPVPYFNWTGLYLGINGGGGWGNSNHTDLNFGNATGDFGISGGLIGAGRGDEELESAMGAGAAELSDGHLFDDADVWYVADAIPEGKTAAVALIEHRWAIPLRDKIMAADGVVLADEWVHPADLVAIGANAAEAAHSTT